MQANLTSFILLIGKIPKNSPLTPTKRLYSADYGGYPCRCHGIAKETVKMATSRQMSGSSDISKNSFATLPQLDAMTDEELSDLLDQTLSVKY